MSLSQRDLAGLLGSRICHDLISPIGAIGNGLELMSMGGGREGPEMALINESVINANARIRLYRIAFGAGGDGERLPHTEIVSILDAATLGGRLNVRWEPVSDVLRQDTKLLFLLIQCCENAMPYGGDIEVTLNGPTWSISCRSEKLKIVPEIWQYLTDPGCEVDLTPAQVQFALVPHSLADTGRKVSLATTDTSIDIKV